jgi:hypothetical protein
VPGVSEPPTQPEESLGGTNILGAVSSTDEALFGDPTLDLYGGFGGLTAS